MKKHFIIIFLILILIPLAGNWLNSKAKFRLIDISTLNSEAKYHLQGDSEVGLLKNLLYFAGSEGNFRGNITQKKLPNADLQVIIRDVFVPDDSIGIQEQRFVVKNVGGKFNVVEYSERGSCKSFRFNSLVLNILSVFIYPLWVHESCV